MRDSISIGSTPFAEDCAQLGSDGYTPRARKECVAFIQQIRRVMGPEPPGAMLKIKSNPHDFGSYLDVECVFDDSDNLATEYAFACEGCEKLEFWDQEAKYELGLAKRPIPANETNDEVAARLWQEATGRPHPFTVGAMLATRKAGQDV